MPDRTLCTNAVCPSRKKCYRAMAKPKEYNQSYMEFKFGTVGGITECFDFLEISDVKWK